VLDPEGFERATPHVVDEGIPATLKVAAQSHD